MKVHCIQHPQKTDSPEVIEEVGGYTAVLGLKEREGLNHAKVKDRSHLAKFHSH